MYCGDHKREFQFMCKSQGCNYTLLCSECRKTHLMSSKSDRNIHLSSIIQIRRAFEEAEQNLVKNRDTLQQLIDPFENQTKVLEKIEFQKKKLIRERDAIIEKIQQSFDAEIRQLQSRNQQIMIKNKEGVPLEQIHTKIKNIRQLQRQYKINSNKLKQALNYTQEPFLNNLRKNNSSITSMNLFNNNQYFIYDDDLKHDFYLSKLQLKKKSLKSKPLKKVYNESQLYFVVDRPTETNFLHYFSPRQSILRVYNIENEKWKTYSSSDPLPLYSATIYDSKRQRFYLVGGEQGNRKSGKIIWYHREQGWGSANLKLARSSAMITLLDSGKQYHDLLLIGGGIGENKKPLKHCELFDPQKNESKDLPPMNFGVSSGTMVTYNGNIIFKLGGLGQFNSDSSSICEVIEKFDYGEYVKNGFENWTYIELQVVSSRTQQKFKLFYANQAAIQINPNEIFVFGGWSHANIGVRESYIIQIQTFLAKNNKKSSRYFVRWINEKPLVSGQGFADLRPIIYKLRIMSLQNISHGQNQILQKEKKLIEFNMYEWQETQNIVTL